MFSGLELEKRWQALGLKSYGEVDRKELVNAKLEWFDPEVGAHVPSWLQIPFEADRDLKVWQELREHGLNLIERLRPMIEARSLTPEFAFKWGALSEIGRIFEEAWLSPERDYRHLKSAELSKVESQKRWYSLLYLKLEPKYSKRREIDDEIYEFAHKVIENGHFPDQRFPLKWYKEIVSDRDLRKSFNLARTPRV